MTSYLAQLRATANTLDPLSALVLDAQKRPGGSASDPIRSVLAELTGRASSLGIIRISTREVYLKLGIPPSLKLSASKRVAEAMRSLGWTQCRMGRSPTREWGWMKRDYDLAVRQQKAGSDAPSSNANSRRFSASRP
jgi:hypothetical protein